MNQIDISESFVQEEEKNQFLDAEFNYQTCPHCSRNFFLGKLKFHLKLCNSTNPMTKSPLKKAKRSYVSTTIDRTDPDINQSQLQSPTSLKSPQKSNKCPKCQYCKASFPFSMIERHSEKCNLKPELPKNTQDLNYLKSKTKIDFGFKKDLKEPASALPRIRNSARENKNVQRQRKFVSQDVKDLKAEYTVRIREQLSCFKKALQVQQIECQYCNRKFSKEASLRHIPICQKIKLQEIQQVASKKHSKSQIYKLSVPIKKSTLFRSKFLGTSNQKNEDFQIKSARLHEMQKIDRQKINNSSLLVKKQVKIDKGNFSDIRPLMTKPKQKIENKQQKAQKSLEQARNQNKDTIEQMNMTFSKDLNKSSTNQGLCMNIFNKQKISQQLPTFQKEVENHQTKFYQPQTNSALKQIEPKIYTQGVQNEFLQVTVSKKKIFAEISFNEEQFETKKITEESVQPNKRQSQKMKLKIDLVDFSRKSVIETAENQEEYKLEFQN